MTDLIDPEPARWLTTESAAERREHAAAWQWLWVPARGDEAPRQFLWDFTSHRS